MKLLVIEDYDPLRTAVVQGLTEAGFTVDSTGDGEEGLWYARDQSYDVIVLDLMLPGLDGLTLLNRIRSDGNRAPVLILTAKDTVDDRVRGLNLGADDYVVKPFAFEELLARVNTMARRKYDVHSNVIEVADLRIDLAGRRVMHGDRELPLTPIEFGVLEQLAIRLGRTVSRSELTDHLYGFDLEPNSNSIDVHISNLRRKLEQAGLSQMIRTRRGMGYQLIGRV